MASILRGRRSHVALITVALGGATLWSAAEVRAGNNGKREQSTGKFAELTADWWQWAFAEPVDTNPLFDQTGEFASEGQPAGNVFFIGGYASLLNTSSVANVNRDIAVPAGKALFFPIVNTEAANKDTPPDSHTVPEWRAVVASFVDNAVDVHASLDGGSLEDAIMRVKSPVFSYVLPLENNIYQAFGVPINGIVKDVVSDGYWVYLPPLPKGIHTLSFGGTLPGPFTLNITYTITVP